MNGKTAATLAQIAAGPHEEVVLLDFEEAYNPRLAQEMEWVMSHPCRNSMAFAIGTPRRPGVTALGEKVLEALRAQRQHDWLKR